MNLTELFCKVDDFFKKYKNSFSKEIHGASKGVYSRAFRMSSSEILTICIFYHQSGYRHFKAFYLNEILKNLRSYFPKAVSYNRFVELKSKSLKLFACFFQSLLGKCTGISFIDSTPLQVCKPKRASRNKVFKGLGHKGKSTIGWFFGFKLHLIINEFGEILKAEITKANIDDRTPVLKMTNNIFGKLFGDKGYISGLLSGNLMKKGVQLITGLKKNMKNKFVLLMDKLLLRKRSIIETVNDQLKNISNIEHSRHRSPKNFAVNFFCSLISYSLKPKKPSIKGIKRNLLNVTI